MTSPQQGMLEDGKGPELVAAGGHGVCANGEFSTQQDISCVPLSLSRELTTGHLTHRPLSILIYPVVTNACLPVPALGKYGLVKLPVVRQADICEP